MALAENNSTRENLDKAKALMIQYNISDKKLTDRLSKIEKTVVAQETAESERIVAEKKAAEEARIAAEQKAAEEARVAAEKAERERIHEAAAVQAQQAAQQAQQAAENTQQTVLITPTGSKYHSRKCGNGTYTEATLEAAQQRGLTPCSKCF